MQLSYHATFSTVPCTALDASGIQLFAVIYQGSRLFFCIILDGVIAYCPYIKLVLDEQSLRQGRMPDSGAHHRHGSYVMRHILCTEHHAVSIPDCRSAHIFNTNAMYIVHRAHGTLLYQSHAQHQHLFVLIHIVCEQLSSNAVMSQVDLPQSVGQQAPQGMEFKGPYRSIPVGAYHWVSLPSS